MSVNNHSATPCQGECALLRETRSSLMSEEVLIAWGPGNALNSMWMKVLIGAKKDTFFSARKLLEIFS